MVVVGVALSLDGGTACYRPETMECRLHCGDDEACPRGFACSGGLCASQGRSCDVVMLADAGGEPGDDLDLAPPDLEWLPDADPPPADARPADEVRDGQAADAEILFASVPTAVVRRPGDPASVEIHGITRDGRLVCLPGPAASADLFHDLGVPDRGAPGDTLRLLGTPTAVSWEPERVDVFVQGTDQQLYQRWLKDSWRDWVSLRGPLVSSDPALASWGVQRLDLFVRSAANSELLHTWYESGWAPLWDHLGGALASAPSAVSSDVERIDIVARDDTGAVLHLSFDSTGWSGWSSLGGSTRVAPSATSRRRGVADIYLADEAGRLKELQVSAFGHTEWKDTAILVSGEFRAVAFSRTRVLVLSLTPDGSLEMQTIDYPDDASPDPAPRDAGGDDTSMASSLDTER